MNGFAHLSDQLRDDIAVIGLTRRVHRYESVPVEEIQDMIARRFGSLDVNDHFPTYIDSSFERLMHLAEVAMERHPQREKLLAETVWLHEIKETLNKGEKTPNRPKKNIPLTGWVRVDKHGIAALSDTGMTASVTTQSSTIEASIPTQVDHLSVMRFLDVIYRTPSLSPGDVQKIQAFLQYAIHHLPRPNRPESPTIRRLTPRPNVRQICISKLVELAKVALEKSRSGKEGTHTKISQKEIACMFGMTEKQYANLQRGESVVSSAIKHVHERFIDSVMSERSQPMPRVKATKKALTKGMQTLGRYVVSKSYTLDSRESWDDLRA